MKKIKAYHLGYFKTEDEAHLAYTAKAAELYKAALEEK